MSDNHETETSTTPFHQLTNDQITTCVTKAFMKVLPQLIEDEDILQHLVNELLVDNSHLLKTSQNYDESELETSKNDATMICFSALSNLKGEKKQKSLTLLINILSEHLANYDLTIGEEDTRQTLTDLQEHLQKIRLGNFADYGVNVDEQDDDDGAYVEDGCCVMCEREMKLTRHHLIPRMKHRKFLKRQQYSKEHLNKVILICRVCHDAVHSFISLDEMAETYHTLDTILEHPKVQKWIPYVARQRNTRKFRF